MENFDLIVIGSGPGGYVAAVKAAQLGLKTALIEKYPKLGGTCLNVGCIPSKALLDSSERFYEASTKYKERGIKLSAPPKLDWSQMLQHKQKVVTENNSGINYLMKKNKISVFTGEASFISPNEVKIAKSKQQLTAPRIIIATGSKPATIPQIKLDGKRIITSTEALSLEKFPKSMVIVGGGVIGIEMGSIYARLGCEVHIIEALPRILANMDASLSKGLSASLKKLGIKFYLGHKLSSLTATAKQVKLSATSSSGQTVSLTAEYCLIATGRKPHTAGLNLDKIGIKQDKRGFILVDEKLETSQPGVFAIGDVIGGLMLAHKAEEEAVFVVEKMLGQSPQLNHKLIPNVVYTWPEVASVGLSEEECKEQNLAVKIGSFPFMALGRARASEEREGLVKIISDQKTDEVLGAHIVGARASDLIMEIAIAMSFRASAEDIARISHPHPTFSEALKEAAALAWEKRTIHL